VTSIVCREGDWVVHGTKIEKSCKKRTFSAMRLDKVPGCRPKKKPPRSISIVGNEHREGKLKGKRDARKLTGTNDLVPADQQNYSD